MPTIDVAFTKLAVSKSAKEDVMGPQDLRGFNVRTVSVSAAGGSGKLALADAANVLPDQKDAVVPLHLLIHGRPKGFAERDEAHASTSS